jgi:hypothetical protein
MHRRVLTLSETVLGKEYPDLLTSMNNLATVLSDLGKHGEAEEMYRPTPTLRKTIAEHPHTLLSRNNLAAVLSSQGKIDAVEELY